MKCPRCDSNLVTIMVKAPVNNEWEVYLCDICKFSWRNTEDKSITDPELYDKRFKLNSAEFGSLSQIPPIPPLNKK